MNNKNIIIDYGFIDSLGSGKETTHYIEGINIDNYENTISINIRKGIVVNTIKLSIENAREIGFINFNALKIYCK